MYCPNCNHYGANQISGNLELIVKLKNFPGEHTMKTASNELSTRTVRVGREPTSTPTMHFVSHDELGPLTMRQRCIELLLKRSDDQWAAWDENGVTHVVFILQKPDVFSYSQTYQLVKPMATYDEICQYSVGCSL